MNFYGMTNTYTLQLWESGVGGEEVRARSSCALRQALQCCLHRPALEPLLHTAPSPLLECVLTQYAKVSALSCLDTWENLIYRTLTTSTKNDKLITKVLEIKH